MSCRPSRDPPGPGVGRRAVQRLRSERVLAELDRYVRVVEVGEATDLGVGQEEVPEAGLLGLGLGAVEHLELTRREGPRVGPSLTEAEVLLLHRSDDLFEEADHSLVQRLSPLAHAQVEQLRSLRSEEHTSELQSIMRISDAGF